MARSTRSAPKVPARWRRAAAFAATSGLLATFAHAVAGGAVPDGWLLAVGVALLVPAAVPLLGRQRTSLEIFLALGLAQAALHGWLAVTAVHSHHHAGSSSATAMLLAHAGATILAGLWLGSLERRVWDTARAAWLRVVLGLGRFPRLPAIEPPSRPQLRRAPRSLSGRFLTTAAPLRGPPAAVGP